LLFLNEWAVVPLTKKAKAAQKKYKAEYAEQQADKLNDDDHKDNEEHGDDK
jgi:hypothetical protein